MCRSIQLRVERRIALTGEACPSESIGIGDFGPSARARSSSDFAGPPTERIIGNVRTVPPNLAVAVMAGIIDRHLLRPCTDAQGADRNRLPRNPQSRAAAGGRARGCSRTGGTAVGHRWSAGPSARPFDRSGGDPRRILLMTSCQSQSTTATASISISHSGAASAETPTSVLAGGVMPSKKAERAWPMMGRSSGL